jgi:signal peptidase I
VLLYGRVICAYERHSLEERQGRYFVDGEPAEHYTFEMDYYWMMGDNRHNSADSRAWGFVPEDHVVGKPMRVWLSLDKDRNWFQGKIRWKRFMKKAV